MHANNRSEFSSLAAAHRWLVRTYGVGSLLGSSGKVHKSRKRKTLTRILYIAAHRRVGGRKGPGAACPAATAACVALCLGEHSGHMPRTGVQRAQAARSAAIGDAWRDDTHRVWAVLRLELANLVQSAARKGMIPSVRLNGTSDLRWHSHPVIVRLRAEFPTIVFYDYTKHNSEFRRSAARAGWDLTLSATERDTPDTIRAALDA